MNIKVCNSSSIYLDDFLPSTSGACSEADTFDSHEVLGNAKVACAAQNMCIGVLDKGCGTKSKNKGTYRLCKKGFTNPSDSCIYQKKLHSCK